MFLWQERGFLGRNLPEPLMSELVIETRCLDLLAKPVINTVEYVVRVMHQWYREGVPEEVGTYGGIPW